MKRHRQKLSLIQTMNLFPDDDTAEQWFIDCRWQHGVNCPTCGSNRVGERTTAKRSWRCKDCRKDFSTKTGTLMQGSNLGFRVWAIAIYQLTTSLKGIASTKLASDLGITQKAAWHLAMRIRETYGDRIAQLQGVVEVDETYIGGKKLINIRASAYPGGGRPASRQSSTLRRGAATSGQKASPGQTPTICIPSLMRLLRLMPASLLMRTGVIRVSRKYIRQCIIQLRNMSVIKHTSTALSPSGLY